MTAGNCVDVDAEYLEAGTPAGRTDRHARPAPGIRPIACLGGRPDVAL